MEKSHQSLFFNIIILSAAVALCAHFAKTTNSIISSRYQLINEIPLSSLKREIIDVIMLGQSPLYDNFVHLWTTQYLGSDDILEIDPVTVSMHLDKLLNLKIQSESFYTLGCFRFIFHYKTPELCEPIAHAGMTAMPENWMIPATLGYAYLLQKKFSEAAIYFAATATREGAPKYFNSVGKKILKKNNVDLEIPNEILHQMGSSDTMQRIIKKLHNN